ncbi:aminopeptidase N [Gottschalkia purinilytica]|uniref:Aminopeptidase N n=1 Tax=Gottschalkia purinilytica TaxID=1503 RepID=A0A0L0WD75_GOTPU|nr:hypothetical protein [Gottschalkia purinilytica]KNF09417.1 aminopeptidase N [Gottschalkia purinilytica]
MIFSNLVIDDVRLLEIILKDTDFINNLAKIRNTFKYYKKVHIKLFYSLDDMKKYLNISNIPYWVIATTYENEILILDYNIWKSRHNESFGQIIMHEMIHIIINYKTNYTCPLWLNEGLALYFANQENFKEVSIDCNPFELGYESENFYDMCLYIIKKLVHIYSINTIVDKISLNRNFKYDEILGIENLRIIFEK